MKTFFVSLGCDKNLSDSEEMIGLLTKAGHSIVSDDADCDVVVINTCCFILDAKTESIEVIIEYAEKKKAGLLKGIVVCGCLAEKYREEIQKEIPEVDVVLGATAYDEIANAVDMISKGKQENIFKPLTYLPLPDGGRVNTTGGYYDYLKIAEGCDKHCTYCIIPSLKGPYRSIPMERLLATAEKMASKGVKELLVVAQETTLYGFDLYGEKKLHVLLEKLCGIEGIEKIRVLYCYPEEIYDELIDVMAREEKICKYLDMPIQHASDAVLKRMGRKTTRADLEALIIKLREKMPDITLRTSLITGFPGETEKDHKELLSFVKKSLFDRLGVFTYSKEEGSPAAKMKPQILKKDKIRRQKEIMLLQQSIAFKKAKKKKGLVTKAIIDGYLPEDDVYVGRTDADAPGVDGLVFIEGNNAKLLSGDIVTVKITGAREYDLTAVICE